MVRASNDARKSVTPDDRVAQTVPPEVAGSHSFLLQAIFELKGSFSRVEEKIDTLKDRVEKMDGSVNTLEHTVSKVRGAIIVGGLVFTLAIAVVGWMVAGDVKVTMGDGDKLRPAGVAASPPK
jgi:hypothetical protein